MTNRTAAWATALAFFVFDQLTKWIVGGPMGLTQLGRIEAALHGVLLNTDFIDNSAGVDTSDHEVNIKILLNDVVRAKKLTVEQRNKLLASMTEEVGQLHATGNQVAHVHVEGLEAGAQLAPEARGLVRRPAGLGGAGRSGCRACLCRDHGRAGGDSAQGAGTGGGLYRHGRRRHRDFDLHQETHDLC